MRGTTNRIARNPTRPTGSDSWNPDTTTAAEIPEILRLLVVLSRDLGHQDSAAREKCARVLGCLGSGEAVAPLSKAMRKEKVLQTLLAMGDALAQIGGRRAIDALRGMRDEAELGPRALDWLAKAALLHLTQSLALELAPDITVNAIVPSQIASPRTDSMAQYKAAAIAGTPLGRLVTQAEIAQVAVHLCSPEFAFVTGQAIVMDGGRTLPRFPKLDLVQE